MTKPCGCEEGDARCLHGLLAADPAADITGFEDWRQPRTILVDGVEIPIRVTGLDEPWASGWLERDGSYTWEIHHPDGRVERFRDVDGVRYEDHP